MGLTLSNGQQVAANTRETLAFAAGGRDPFINPPANSTAGRKHRQRSIQTTGIDPYGLQQQVLSAAGFVPNFARGNPGVLDPSKSRMKPEQLNALDKMQKHFLRTGFVPGKQEVATMAGLGKFTGNLSGPGGSTVRGLLQKFRAQNAVALEAVGFKAAGTGGGSSYGGRPFAGS